MSVVRALSRFTRSSQTALPAAHGRTGQSLMCELCAREIGQTHSHVVDLEERSLSCACRPCALLFDQPGVAKGRYRTVPQRYFQWTPDEAEARAVASLELPVGLAFFFFNSRQQRWVAHYPSPAGPTESELPLDAWPALVRANPLLSAAAPDVEAILVHTPRGSAHGEWFLVPIDACYELVGILRTAWKGFDGGDTAREQLGRFFGSLRERSQPFEKNVQGGA